MAKADQPNTGGNSGDTGRGAGDAGGSGSSRFERGLIMGALDQADRMALSSLSVNLDDEIGPDDRTSAEAPISGSGATQARRRSSRGVRSRAVDLPPGFFPGYDVVREVHRGGQGVVFEAVDRTCDEKVAIKLLHGGSGSDNSAVARFEREVDVLEGMNHEGIVRVHGSGRTVDGGFYYVMDYIAGEPLDVVVRRLRTGLMEGEAWEQTRSKFTLFARSMTGLRARGLRHRAVTKVDPAADPESSIIAASRAAGHGADGHGADARAEVGAEAGAATPEPRTVHPAKSGTVQDAVSGRSRSVRSRSSIVSAADPELRKLLELFAQVCDAVAAAHMRGVIHRDLKPANIRLDTRGNPILVDFGLAKLDMTDPASAERAVMTQTGQFVGSMPWASPEQAAGEHASVDVRSDVYSLGVILYQFVTGGRFPYKVVGSVREVLDAILYSEPTRPSEWGRRVSDELETIVLKALAKPRDRRYQSAGEFGRDVRRYLAGEPIEAKRDSAWYVLSKTIQRNKAPTGIAATLMAASLTFSVVLGPLYARAERASNEANVNFARAVNANGEVRDLVSTLLYDFHDQIEHLTGATAARELLLTNAVKYLDLLRARMIDDRDNDWRLIQDVAEAHEQVADLYGSSNAANLGNTELAGEHLRESRRLREVLLAAQPDNPAVLIGLGENGEKTAQWFQRTGEFDRAAEEAQNARRRFEQALALDPASLLAQFGAAQTFDIEADQSRRKMNSAATPEDARGHAETAVELYDRCVAMMRDLVDDGAGDLGGNHMKNPRRSLAAAVLNKGFAHLELANFLRGQADASEDAEVAQTFRAEAEAEAGTAVPLVSRALDEMTRLAVERPEVHDFQRDVVIAHYSLGQAYEQLAGSATPGEEPTAEQRAYRSAAVETLEIGLDLARQLATDRSDLEAQRDVSLLLNRLTRVYNDAGDFERALEYGLASVRHRQRVADIDPAVRHIRDVAVAEFMLGEIASSRAEAAGEAGDPTADLGEARAWYQGALDRFIGLQARGTPADREIGLLEGLIAKIEGQLGEAR